LPLIAVEMQAGFSSLRKLEFGKCLVGRGWEMGEMYMVQIVDLGKSFA